MDVSETWECLARPKGGRIVYLIIDGLGGLPDPNRGGTELQAARSHNLDRLATRSSCGLLEMVGPGITPGSGPGHLALFGYDPLKYTLGRGVLSALGIDFDLQEGDVAARVNFATVDAEGKVVDRRAGRISTEINRRLCGEIREGVVLDFDGTYFFETVSEHRAVFVLRGDGLGGRLRDTDPQKTGVPPLPVRTLREDSERTAGIVRDFIDRAQKCLADEEKANMVLFRGFERYHPLPSLNKRFKIRGICIAEYPMYRGVSRLLGMETTSPPEGIEGSIERLKDLYGRDYDFYFLHIKKTDSSGEDGDFDKKIQAIEAIDAHLPKLLELDPDVLVVTADHSTPALMGSHSWHPVPVMIHSKLARVDDVVTFDEIACGRGALGQRPGLHLMGLALAHAGRLDKFGA